MLVVAVFMLCRFPVVSLSWCVMSEETTTTNDDTVIVIRRLVATSLAVTWHLFWCQKGDLGMDGVCLPALGTTPSPSDEVARPLMCCFVVVTSHGAGGACSLAGAGDVASLRRSRSVEACWSGCGWRR